jgi:uncharacterized protein (DUF983 family)
MFKGSKLYSILHQKCPRCHEGDMFETSSFAFKKSFDMLPACPHCGQRYNLETGFYYGAMFLSYAIVALYMFGGFAILYFLMGIDVWWAFGSLVVGAGILYVWFFRVSRIVWLNFFVDYKKLPQNSSSTQEN